MKVSDTKHLDYRYRCGYLDCIAARPRGGACGGTDMMPLLSGTKERFVGVSHREYLKVFAVLSHRSDGTVDLPPVEPHASLSLKPIP
jgi:hypothetical protein